MKLFIALVVMWVVVSADNIAYYAAPGLRVYPYVYGMHSSSLVTPTQQQYHSQDGLGQYSYGYSEPLSAKQEVRSLDGITRGSYSYRDPEGKLQTVDYTADADGFHVAATNLPRAMPIGDFRQHGAPIPISDTVEVAAAREAHFAAHQEAKLRLATTEPVDNESISVDGNGITVELPHPVEDTPQVAAAKAIHLRRLQQEKMRNEALREHNAIVSPGFVRSTLPVAFKSNIIPSIYSYSYPANSRFLAHGFYY